MEKPILATNYSTVKDQLKNKKEGLIVDMTSKAVSDGVMMLRKDNELYNSIQNYLKESQNQIIQNLLIQFIEHYMVLRLILVGDIYS